MHVEAMGYLLGALRQFELAPKSVLELGARNVNGSARAAFPGIERYVGVDIAPGDGVDVVADAATFDTGERFDMVVCMETLEHTPLGREIVINAVRLLNPGGVVIVTAAGPARGPHSAIDGQALKPGEYYGNIDRGQLIEWLVEAGCEPISVQLSERRDDIYGLGVKPS